MECYHNVEKHLTKYRIEVATLNMIMNVVEVNKFMSFE